MTSLDSRGWNTSNGYGDTERRVELSDVADLRSDRNLKIGYIVALFGFVVAGVLTLLSGVSTEGIG